MKPNSKKADKDMVVYKIMRRELMFGGLITLYTTPVIGMLVPFLFKGRVVRAKGSLEMAQYRKTDWIGRGVIHVLTSSAAERCTPCPGCVIFECVIPKGTEYIEDMYGDEIGAKKIKFIKQVKF